MVKTCALLLLLFACNYTLLAQMDSVYSTPRDFVNWRLQLTQGSTYFYTYSDCTRYGAFTGRYSKSGDTIILETVDTFAPPLPYTMRTGRLPNSSKFIFRLDNIHPDYHTQVFFDGRLKYDSDSIQHSGISDMNFFDYKISINNISVRYRLLTATEYDTLYIPVNGASFVAVYPTIPRVNIIKHLDETNRKWLMKNGTLIRLSMPRVVLYIEPHVEIPARKIKNVRKVKHAAL